MKDKNGIHYFEVKDLVTQFVAAFDSVVVGRFKGRTKESEHNVRYVHAPKQKVLHDLVNKAQHITVPVISSYVTSISRDESRVESKNLGHYINSGKQYSYEIPQPVPVNIGVSMSIITRYQDDMDQILANFIPYVNPYIIISWKLPDEFAPSIGTELRSEVLWDENISITQPIDMGEGGKYRNIAETTFIIKGWLFKRHPENPIGNIYEVDTKYYPISSMSQYTSTDLDVYDSRSLSSYPVITETLDDTVVIDDNYVLINNTVDNIVINGQTPTLKFEGDNFQYTDAVYLSADSGTILGDPMLAYDGYSGFELSSYIAISDNVLYVTTPQLNDTGNISVIVQNPSGYVVSDPIKIIDI
jgi:hypothetical protein